MGTLNKFKYPELMVWDSVVMGTEESIWGHWCIDGIVSILQLLNFPLQPLPFPQVYAFIYLLSSASPPLESKLHRKKGLPLQLYSLSDREYHETRV